jgi:cytochrome c oxidase subunit II
LKFPFRSFKRVIISLIVGVLANVSALAGQPRPWQMGFQESASPAMDSFVLFHHYLLYMVYGVTIFVMVLLVYVIVRFNAKRNPVPSTTTHNTLLEIVWTALPAIICVLIAIPSLRILYKADQVPQSEMTLKVIGYQWYWGYQYPDQGNISFDSNYIQDKDIKPDQVRLLSVDRPVYLPVDTNIRIQITASDVIHAWAVPALGIKKDAVPGRLNETWVRIEKPGVYYGQCSELCGAGHGYMPIEIRALPKAEFEQWAKQQKL